ncbi:MAG: glucose-6-phosphate isomerase [Bacteroidales bacterium]
MSQITLNLENATSFIEGDLSENYAGKSIDILRDMEKKSEREDEFLGWLNLPEKLDNEILDKIENTARLFKENYEAIVLVGIGGSYLGAKAVIHALSPLFQNSYADSPEIFYAGHNLDEDYHYELLEQLQDKDYGVVVISKSGTTTEPGIAFRLLKQDLERKLGKEETSKRIIAITDARKGALRKLAEEENFISFVIPDNIGGRYSVLTPVGLVPIALAGHNIRDMIEGAENMRKVTTSEVPFEKNIAAQYAAIRNELYEQGKIIELFGIYSTRLHYIQEWWRQLFGESEGKDGKGIFPSSVEFTTDLHSMGQYIQDGRKMMFETILSLYSTDKILAVPSREDDTDQLNYLAEKPVHEINIMAESATRLAHVDGGVPNIILGMPRINAYNLGQLLYFFEKSCAISGKLLGVNPFDQPGVEAYKKNMFALLQKPGFETESEKLLKRVNPHDQKEKLF